MKVLIQAGHEGRTSGATGAAAYGLREIDLTPIVADEATAILRSNGIDVVRVAADNLDTVEDLALAVSIHFDGNPDATAQVIYDDTSDQPAAQYFKDMYDRVWPFGFMNDNTTPLRDSTGYARYYGFRYWSTTDSEMVIEFGSLGDPAQAAWLKRPGVIPWLGDCLARFILKRLQYMYAAGLAVDMVPFEDSPYNPTPPPPPPTPEPPPEPDPEIAVLEAKVAAQASVIAALKTEQSALRAELLRVQALLAQIRALAS